ncbi:hypothetical protein BDN72DRAFT_840795 [Pluteus cervinus]|uniref:Uncharacterized protein n=1 Tax=Pluteus cervinus TaxID=181527 RepID=A0ACD3AUZ6_9AGAR|nr:hypothetical protein BDN72DRAFT_840795 [Pluteus cervinus]
MASTVGPAEGLGIHRGAIDQTMITILSPPVTIKRIRDVLQSMGIQVREESTYRFRCVRPRKQGVVLLARDAGEGGADDGNQGPNLTLTFAEETPSKDEDDDVYDEATSGPPPSSEVLYGQQTEDPGDELRFSVELTKIDRLEGTYSLDLRRLRGNLRSYKFIYCEFRDRISLQ